MIDFMKRTYIERSIRIKVKGPLSIVTGEYLELPADKVRTVRDIHKYLIQNYKDMAIEKGLGEVVENLDSQNLILVNGREINTLAGLDTNIGPDDEIVIINYTHGG